MSDNAVEIPSGESLRGRLRVPSSKSVTHRVLALTLLGRQAVEVERPLQSDDTDRMIAALTAVGWRTQWQPPRLGLRPLSTPMASATIDCGSAGTALRLLTGVLSALPGRWRLVGSDRLHERPLAPLILALRGLGAEIHCLKRQGFAPLDIRGGALAGGNVEVAAGESSQFLSAILLASLGAAAPVEVEVTELTSRPYVDLTIEAIERFGGHVERHERCYRVEPGLRPPPRLEIDGDFSAAAYWAAGAALTAGEVELEGLRADSKQGDRGFLDLLTRMGAAISWQDDCLIVRGTGRLEAVDVDLSDMPDQVPTLAALAPFANGTTRIRNVAHLRLKESDRLAAMRQELGKIGVPVVERPDGLEITGVWCGGDPSDDPITVNTWDDHRIAMSLALVGLRRPNLRIRQAQVVDKSYPGFWRAMKRLLAR